MGDADGRRDRPVRPDLVHFALGHKWDYAIGIVQVFGLMAGFNQIGFNWSAFYRAIGRTKPIATTAVVAILVTLAVAVPLLVSDGIDGFAVGMALVTLVLIGMRALYLARLFPLLGLARHILRAVLPTVPGVLVVGLMRLAADGTTRTFPMALAEGLSFALVTAGLTAVAERALLGELVSYLRRAPATVAP